MLTLSGYHNAEDCIRYANREDGEGACQNASRAYGIRTANGTTRDEHKHRVSCEENNDVLTTSTPTGALTVGRYEQLTLRANALREELHTEVERMLNDIIKFKVHIQKNLEDYEGFVVEEVEQELGGDEEREDTCTLNTD
jgi:hypothetical protein